VVFQTAWCSADGWIPNIINRCGEWLVEYSRGCYVTIFAGPAAEKAGARLFRGTQSGAAENDTGALAH
jgi:hypothetical protein